jgi:lysophospholipase L1-like esterase
MAKKIINLKLDLNGQSHNPRITVRRNDFYTNVFAAQILQNGVPVDLTGCAAVFECVTPARNAIRDDGSENGTMAVTDAVHGKIEYTLTDKLFASLGIIDLAYFAFEKTVDGKVQRMTTGNFVFQVDPDAMTGNIPAQDYFSDIETMLEQINILKQEYETLDPNTYTKLDVFNQNNADVTVKLAKTSTFFEQFFKSLDFIKDAGSLIFIGDSISAGYGLPYSDQYISKLFNLLKNSVGYPNDFEVITNFSEDNTVSLSGSYSIGTSGPCKKSLVMQPGASISFTGSVQYIDLIFNRSVTSGKIAVAHNGNVYKIIDCGGGTDLYATSFPTVSSGFSDETTYTLTCQDGPVELIGLIRLQQQNNLYGSINFIRCAVSGETTSDFSDDARLEALQNINRFSTLNQNKIYVIALGTNDIYNPSKANTVNAYMQNLDKIISKLMNPIDKVRIILTAPIIPNEGTWPAVVTGYRSYRIALYLVAQKYGLSVIDYSYLSFSDNLFQDGLHPNGFGTDLMMEHIQKSLAKGINRTSINTTETAFSLINGYTNVGQEYGLSTCEVKNSRVQMSGTLNFGNKTGGSDICVIDSSLAPKKQRVFNLCGFDAGGNVHNVLVKMTTQGHLSLVTDLTDDTILAYLSLEQVSYDL